MDEELTQILNQREFFIILFFYVENKKIVQNIHNLKNITFYYYALVLKTKAMYNKGKLKSS